MIEINMLSNLRYIEYSHDGMNWTKLIENVHNDSNYFFKREIKVTNTYSYNLSQEEIDALLKEIEKSVFKHDPSPKFIDYDAIEKVGDHNETMNNGKCTCGAAATFGTNATHSIWCDKK